MSVTLTAAKIAELTGGTLKGDADLQVSGVASLKLATPSDASFLSSMKYRKQAETSKAGLILVEASWDKEPGQGRTLILCENPDKSFTRLCKEFAPEPPSFAPGIHPSAFVHPSASIGENVHVGAMAVVDEGAAVGANSKICSGSYIGQHAKVGSDCLINPNVSILHRCIVGSKVILHSGTVIGSDGFGYTPGLRGHVKIPQTGIVQIDDDVEIGANCAIDRARFGKTWIKRGVKIDNLVHVAHNVVVGEMSILVGQCGIAGSAELGRGVIVAAQAGVNGHISMGDGSMVAGASGVQKSLPPGSKVLGLPAESEEDFFERHTLPRRVRKLVERVAKLEAQLQDLKKT